MRKSIEYLVEDGEDKGKIFIITRMSAYDADKWARELVMALSRAGKCLLQSGTDLGIGALADVGFSIFGQMNPEDVKAAFDRLDECFQMKRDPRNPLMEPVKSLKVEIEGAHTWKNLRMKAFELHVDFFKKRRKLYFSPRSGSGSGGKRKAGFKPNQYVNLSLPMGNVIGARLTTIEALQTILDSEDLYNLWEIFLVNASNRMQ